MTCVIFCPANPQLLESWRASPIWLCERGRHSLQDVCACGHTADFLCDFVVGVRGRTCNTKLCYCCRIHVGPDRDYCLAHATEAHATPVPDVPAEPAQPALFAREKE